MALLLQLRSVDFTIFGVILCSKFLIAQLDIDEDYEVPSVHVFHIMEMKPHVMLLAIAYLIKGNLRMTLPCSQIWRTSVT